MKKEPKKQYSEEMKKEVQNFADFAISLEDKDERKTSIKRCCKPKK